jgi:hypothetical protein
MITSCFQTLFVTFGVFLAFLLENTGRRLLYTLVSSSPQPA